MINDSELIYKTKSGDLTAFDQLMGTYEKLIYKISYGFGRNKENALDISQDVFFKVYQKLSSFRGDSSFKSWLVKIAYNEGVNWVRNNKYIQKQSSFDSQHEMMVPSISNEDEFLAKEHKSELIRSLYNLNTRYRLAVVLRYFEDMPIRDIALTLECSEGVVKNMLFRSLRKLKDILQAKDNME